MRATSATDCAKAIRVSLTAGTYPCHDKGWTGATMCRNRTPEIVLAMHCNRTECHEISGDSMRIFRAILKNTQYAYVCSASVLQNAYANARLLRGNSAYLHRFFAQSNSLSTQVASAAGSALLKFAACIHRAHGFRSIPPALRRKAAREPRDIGRTACSGALRAVESARRGVGIVPEIVPAEASPLRFAPRAPVRRRAA